VKNKKKALTFQNQVLQIVILVFSKKGGKENKNLFLYKCSKWVPSCFRDAGNAIYLYRICQMPQIKGILNQKFHEEKSQSTPTVSWSPHDIKIYMTTLCMHTKLHFCSKKYDLKVQINFYISHYSSLQGSTVHSDFSVRHNEYHASPFPAQDIHGDIYILLYYGSYSPCACQAIISDVAEILQNMIQEERMSQRTSLAQQQ
jgi:hypothetical protein